MKSEKKCGQLFEMLSFLVLAIAITGVIIFLKFYSVTGFGRVERGLAERHESEGFRAGANAFLMMTEEKTGKTLRELIGIAAYIGNDTIDFGPVIGKINVTKEIEWRLDALYGPKHWYLHVPYPHIAPDIQIVVVVDTSGSLCDDVNAMVENLPDVVEELRKVHHKKVSMRIYLLNGNLNCCDHMGGTISCLRFPDNEYLDCKTMERIGGKFECSELNPGQYKTEEDWGNGLACAIKYGPKGGWIDFAVKVGIPLSDELPGGSESLCSVSGSGIDTEQRKSLENGIKAAKEAGVIVFPLKAETGKECCPKCNCVSGKDKPCNICYKSGTSDEWGFTKTQCKCDEEVTQYMEEIASETGGEMIALTDASKVVDAIKDIVTKTTRPRQTFLDAGDKTAYEKRQREVQYGSKKSLRAVTTPIPVAISGEYTKIYLYQWS